MVNILKSKSKFDLEVDANLDQLAKLSKDSKEYSDIVDNLERLYRAKSLDKQSKVSWDTMAIIAGNLIGILMILSYEKADIITSKAIGFILKGRV